MLSVAWKALTSNLKKHKKYRNSRKDFFSLNHFEFVRKLSTKLYFAAKLFNRTCTCTVVLQCVLASVIFTFIFIWNAYFKSSEKTSQPNWINEWNSIFSLQQTFSSLECGFLSAFSSDTCFWSPRHRLRSQKVFQFDELDHQWPLSIATRFTLCSSFCVSEWRWSCWSTERLEINTALKHSSLTFH